MKTCRIALAIIIALLAIMPVFGDGLELNMHLGLLSGVGVSYNTGRWQFGADLESTFPGFCTFQGIMARQYEDISFWEGFRMGLDYFFGADIYTYFMLFRDDGYAMYAGLDIMMGTETDIRSFETVLRPTVKFHYGIGQRCALFLAAGFSLLDIMYVPGFEKPLVRIPDANVSSVLTGCRVGLSVNLN